MKQPPRHVAAFDRESVFLSGHIEQERRLLRQAPFALIAGEKVAYLLRESRRCIVRNPMRRILYPNQTSVRNLSREPLTIINRLPWIMHSPQTKGRRLNFPVPLHKHSGVIGVESARIANDG